MELDREYFLSRNYGAARQLDDGTWIGINKFTYSLSLYVGLYQFGWSKRYDYENKDIPLLYEQYLKLKTFDDIPSGWVSKRPK